MNNLKSGVATARIVDLPRGRATSFFSREKTTSFPRSGSSSLRFPDLADSDIRGPWLFNQAMSSAAAFSDFPTSVAWPTLTWGLALDERSTVQKHRFRKGEAFNCFFENVEARSATAITNATTRPTDLTSLEEISASKSRRRQFGIIDDEARDSERCVLSQASGERLSRGLLA